MSLVCRVEGGARTRCQSEVAHNASCEQREEGMRLKHVRLLGLQTTDVRATRRYSIACEEDVKPPPTYEFPAFLVYRVIFWVLSMDHSLWPQMRTKLEAYLLMHGNRELAKKRAQAAAAGIHSSKPSQKLLCFTTPYKVQSHYQIPRAPFPRASVRAHHQRSGPRA